VTLAAAQRQYSLSDFERRRVCTILRGREVAPSNVSGQFFYRLPDVLAAIEAVTDRRVQYDLWYCDCGRSWVSEQARQAHEQMCEQVSV
jgi:hypothetical protein